MVLYADFSKSGMDQRIAKIGDKEFDVSEMPVDVYLFTNRRVAERRKEGLYLLAEDYYDIVLMWLKAIDETVTTEWLDSAISCAKLQQIAQAVITPQMNPPLVKFEEKGSLLKGTKSKVSQKNQI